MGRHDGLIELPATLAGREAPAARRSRLRWVPVIALAATALILAVLVVGAAIPSSPRTAGLDATLIQPATPTAAAATTSAATTAPAPTGVQRDLIDLAERLPTGFSLSAPRSWAHWDGAHPTYPRDVDGCPHVSRRLGDALGARWTYVYGTMPQDRCTWVPVPWNPKQRPDERFTFAIGFRQGDVHRLLADAVACQETAATLAVPDVAEGAVLSGCTDPAGTRVRLAVADAGGTGVWYFDGASGIHQHVYAPATVLPALVTATAAWFH